jgi:hypothetical protein
MPLADAAGRAETVDLGKERQKATALQASPPAE